jgi:uncharacterized OB-fold protein
MRLPHNAPLYDAPTGRLVLQRCRVCGEVPNYPRVACPFCLGELEWLAASGRGRVVTYTVVHRPADHAYRQYVPIVMALIALEEGAETISTVVGEDRLETAIGSEVQLAADERWSSLPQFRLRAG